MTNVDPQDDVDALAPPEDERTLARVIRLVEEWFFLLVLIALIVLGLAPIFGREFDWNVGWTGDGEVAQQLVLWIALFGAGAATRDRKHIVIDAVSHFLSERNRLWLRTCAGLIAAAVCGFLTVLSIGYIREEKPYALDEWQFGIPGWYLYLVLPIGFALLTTRFLICTAIDARYAIRWKIDHIAEQSPESSATSPAELIEVGDQVKEDNVAAEIDGNEDKEDST
jgi:TRAP-type C4-dicarboxylate transport system permease small subunit